MPAVVRKTVELLDAQPFRIWGGTQDNASFVGPSTARHQPGKPDLWQQVFLDPWSGGDGFATFPDPHDETIVFFTQQKVIPRVVAETQRVIEALFGGLFFWPVVEMRFANLHRAVSRLTHHFRDRAFSSR